MITQEYRSKEQLKTDFHSRSTVWERIQIATEWYVMLQDSHPEKEYMRRHIPSKTKYLSMIIKYWRDFWWLHAVNPAMNGMWWFIELSKTQTNSHLPENYRPRSIVIAHDTPSDDILASMQAHWIEFPMMIKPDHCEQSYGVVYVRTKDELEIYLKESIFDTFIIETYIRAKKEFGIFVERPWWEQSWVFTVTSCVEKQKPTVVWDWVSTVEILIRWLGMPEDIYERIVAALSADERETILETWIYMVVARTSTSYLWVTQRECTDLITPEIQKKLNDVLSWYEWFYFWRFDIIADSLNDISHDKFWIIELNWSSGIPLHIYSPWKSIVQRHQIMTDHFDRMFTIAADNATAYWYTKYSLWYMIKYFITTISKQKLPWKASNFWKSTWEIIKIYVMLKTWLY